MSLAIVLKKKKIFYNIFRNVLPKSDPVSQVAAHLMGIFLQSYSDDSGSDGGRGGIRQRPRGQPARRTGCCRRRRRRPRHYTAGNTARRDSLMNTSKLLIILKLVLFLSLRCRFGYEIYMVRRCVKSRLVTYHFL